MKPNKYACEKTALWSLLYIIVLHILGWECTALTWKSSFVLRCSCIAILSCLYCPLSLVNLPLLNATRLRNITLGHFPSFEKLY